MIVLSSGESREMTRLVTICSGQEFATVTPSTVQNCTSAIRTADIFGSQRNHGFTAEFML